MPRKSNLAPFKPPNKVEQRDGSPGEEFQTWGPNYDRPPLIACNVDWRNGPGKLLAVFTLRVPHWHVWLCSCRLVKWGPGGERVLLPDATWKTGGGRSVYREIIVFDTDQEQRLFEEAALRAIRAARRNGGTPALVTPKTVVEPPKRSDDVPF